MMYMHLGLWKIKFKSGEYYSDLKLFTGLDSAALIA
jgi:hypothetical protein